MRLLALFAILPLAVACSLIPSARVHAGYMQTDVTGGAGLGTAGSGTPATNDVESSLGVDDPSGNLQLRAEGKIGPVHATARTMGFNGSGAGTLAAPFGSIGQGTTVSSQLDVFDVDLAASWDLVDVGPVRISPGLGYGIYDVSLGVTGGGASEKIAEVYQVPYLFLQGEVEFGPAGAVVDLGWTDIKISDDDMQMVDLSAMLYVQPGAMLELYAGFRSKSFQAESSGGPRRVVDFDLQGWFLGGGVRF